MRQHAEPPESSALPPPPEPSYAERARTLVHVGRAGTLATLSRRRPGHPFASVMPYAQDTRGRPIFLISAMAMHTQNLEGDPRASLLVVQPGHTDDPLAWARVTLMGTAGPLSEPDSTEARALYLERHSKAAAWVDFGDFRFWRLDVSEVYFVGGFAAMDWVDADQYGAARPDPLADAAADIIEHMNRDHADALVTLARAFARAEAEEARMISVDRLGLRLELRSGDRRWAARIAFPREIASAEDSRAVLIDMVRQARQRLSA